MTEQYDETPAEAAPGEYDESEAAPLEADAGDVVATDERYDPAPSRQILKDPTVGTDEAPNVGVADTDQADTDTEPAPLSNPDE